MILPTLGMLLHHLGKLQI